MDDGEVPALADCRPVTDDLIQFIDSYSDMVYRRAGKLLMMHGLSPDDAEDVTAEVANAAVDAWVGWRLVELKPNWLMVVVKRAVARRAAVARPLIGGEAAEALLHALPVASEWCTDTGDDLALKAIACLSPRHRELLLLSVLDDLSDKEIAERLDESLDTIRSARERARKSFRRHYEQFKDESNNGGVNYER